MSKNVATNKHDPLAKFRDPPDGEKRIDDALQFQSGTIEAHWISGLNGSTNSHSRKEAFYR